VAAHGRLSHEYYASIWSDLERGMDIDHLKRRKQGDWTIDYEDDDGDYYRLRFHEPKYTFSSDPIIALAQKREAWKADKAKTLRRYAIIIAKLRTLQKKAEADPWDVQPMIHGLSLVASVKLKLAQILEDREKLTKMTFDA
jgi:hypothetical protein